MSLKLVSRDQSSPREGKVIDLRAGKAQLVANPETRRRLCLREARVVARLGELVDFPLLPTPVLVTDDDASEFAMEFSIRDGLDSLCQIHVGQWPEFAAFANLHLRTVSEQWSGDKVSVGAEFGQDQTRLVLMVLRESFLKSKVNPNAAEMQNIHVYLNQRQGEAVLWQSARAHTGRWLFYEQLLGALMRTLRREGHEPAHWDSALKTLALVAAHAFVPQTTAG